MVAGTGFIAAASCAAVFGFAPALPPPGVPDVVDRKAAVPPTPGADAAVVVADCTADIVTPTTTLLVLSVYVIAACCVCRSPLILQTGRLSKTFQKINANGTCIN